GLWSGKTWPRNAGAKVGGNAMVFKIVNIRNYEIGLHFYNGEFRGLIEPGRHWIWDPLRRTQVEIVSLRAPWLVHEKLDVIVKSGALADRTIVVDLKDYERALVWIDGRLSHLLPPGLYAYWTTLREVKVEVVDARAVHFVHADLPVILKSAMADRAIDVVVVPPNHVGAYFRDGNLVEMLPPGRHAFWKNLADVKVVPVDTREIIVDVVGQDIMTNDKVTLRLNALVTCRVTDARLALTVVDDYRQALYREMQLVLRAAIGARELDTFLTEKDGVVAELEAGIRRRASAFGMEVVTVGIRDVILPGDMKDLFNKVTEAKKAAEANLIARREETAAMRSQANTAKLLQDNPTLMRLRELEVLEKIAANAKLSVVLGDKGLTERLVNVL
ncbi:MAG TPA: slipin family protein, partial [Gemmataceae bacterium]|nr:slipin family protein [Gemmataceae bacterium]